MDFEILRKALEKAVGGSAQPNKARLDKEAEDGEVGPESLWSHRSKCHRQQKCWETLDSAFPISLGN